MDWLSRCVCGSKKEAARIQSERKSLRKGERQKKDGATKVKGVSKKGKKRKNQSAKSDVVGDLPRGSSPVNIEKACELGKLVETDEINGVNGKIREKWTPDKESDKWSVNGDLSEKFSENNINEESARRVIDPMSSLWRNRISDEIGTRSQNHRIEKFESEDVIEPESVNLEFPWLSDSREWNCLTNEELDEAFEIYRSPSPTSIETRNSSYHQLNVQGNDGENRRKEEHADSETLSGHWPNTSRVPRRTEERISSRINFSSARLPDGQDSKIEQDTRNEIKKITARCATPNWSAEGDQRRQKRSAVNRKDADLGLSSSSPQVETNKFGFKRSARPQVADKGDVRRKLNSCSFEVPLLEDSRGTERKGRRVLDGSMIPRLSSPLRKYPVKVNLDGSGESENGRVHSAIVSSINWEQRTVTVEWFEKGETKGKEVEIDAILALNPELLQKTMGPPPQINNHMLASRDSSGEEDEGVDELENQEEGSLGRHGGHTARNGLTSATLPVRVTSRHSHSTRPSIPVKAGSNRQLPRQGGRPTNIMPPTASVNGHNDTLQGLTGRREVENIPPTPSAPASYNVTSVQNKKQIQQQQQQLQQQQQQQQQQQAQQTQAQVENGRGRRSNVVKEVERLKKNREERRQRQAELKEEKEALMNMDPGNPNWEFLAMIREYQNSIEFRPLRETDAVEDHQITVCVRKRPLNKKEIARKEVDVISVPSKDQMVVHEPKAKVDLTKYLENQIFRFDYAFDETCNNEIVYKYTAKPLVQTIFEGGMATCFAYGQTGSGKTHTMGGDFNGKTQDCKKGIYAMVAKDVFKCLKLAKYRPLNLVISASFFEIYSGKVFDLLADKEKLRVLEDGKQQVQILGLTEKVVETCDEVLKLIQHGNSARTSGQTSANSNSSRSHAVFQITARTPGTPKVHGKFSLIDLAGNERGADTSSANRQTRMEGAEINKSLLALKECIRALSRKGTHLPFRASKLTQVLRDSFIGEKSKTCMIAMISPGMSSCEHSLNTLRYADRVKELAATDPTENKSSPIDDDVGIKIEEQSNNSVLSDSDLAQLRSLNEGELSQDLYTFHEAVSALQMLEEEVLDTHKMVMDNTTRFLNDAHSVFSATHEVDYDQEAYAQKWEQLLLQQRDTLNAALDQVSQFRGQLLQEEKISQEMTRMRNSRYN